MYENLAVLIEQVTKLVDELAATDRSAWTDQENGIFNHVHEDCEQISSCVVQLRTESVPQQELKSQFREFPGQVMQCSSNCHRLEVHGRNLSEKQKICLTEIQGYAQQMLDIW